MIERDDRVGWRSPLLAGVHGTVIGIRTTPGSPLRIISVRWDYLPGITGPPSMAVAEGELVVIEHVEQRRIA